MINAVSKVAVLGSGTMGSGIAGLLAGAGMSVVLLDIVPPVLDDEDKKRGLTETSFAFRNKYVQAGLDRILHPKSGQLYVREHGERIRIGNFTDNMDMISDCDWIIESVKEQIDIKKDIMKQIAKHRKPGSIISTNTSGISMKSIVEDESAEFRSHFLGTHFFNPPIFMRLFEVIPTEYTLPEVVQKVEELGRDTLGKGVVYANDTPNFIANRIGVYSSCEAIRLMLKYGFNIPLTDQLTGPVIGRPASAVFRTTDMVGLDILIGVAANVVNNIDDPEEKALFAIPEFVLEMAENGALGDKTRGGFYKRMPDKSILFWNYEKKQYEPLERIVPDVVKSALDSDNKYAAIINGDDKENQFAWELIKRTLLYSAARIPEITSDYMMIDKALVWGYNWEKGPFEIWDAIGVESAVERMKAEGETIPAWVLERLAEGKTSFYYKTAEVSPYITLNRNITPVIKENSEAALLDLDDGVLCLEFRAKGNALGMGVIEILNIALDELKNGWNGMVIGNKGKIFSAGADLNYILSNIDAKDWNKIESEVSAFQMTFDALKYAAKPVVAAPFGMTLGGGAEIALHSLALTPAIGTYIGLVEVGVGLLPGSGGCKEMLARAVERASGTSRAELLPVVKAVWRLIATAAVSSNAFDAISKGFMKRETRVIMNPDAILDKAKAKVLELSKAGFMPLTPKRLPLLGDYGHAAIRIELEAMRGGGFVSEHDALIADKIAYVLTGGSVLANTIADESYILELEREAFLSLCGEEKTRQRIEHMLKTGKPLRN